MGIHERLWSEIQVAAFCEVPVGRVRRMVKQGRLPRPHRITRSTKRWLGAEVIECLLGG
jgi:predicted DNA-binding transcriptional regulator AlpA